MTLDKTVEEEYEGTQWKSWIFSTMIGSLRKQILRVEVLKFSDVIKAVQSKIGRDWRCGWDAELFQAVIESVDTDFKLCKIVSVMEQNEGRARGPLKTLWSADNCK